MTAASPDTPDSAGFPRDAALPPEPRLVLVPPAPDSDAAHGVPATSADELPDVGAAGPEPTTRAPAAPEFSEARDAAPSFVLAARPDPAGPTALLAVASDGARLVPTPDPDPPTADGYLRMTARILLESRSQTTHTIGVVSAHEGEGRTAAAVNLAVCLGRAKGRRGRVLLVDGDARNRALSRLFCGSGPGSLSDSAPASHPALIGTALDSVDLMTAPLLDDGLTVSAPDAWARTFAELGATYPHIVVDCPAVLENPEALVLRECVQQLVLVVRAGASTRSVVQRTLGSASSRVLGVIMNGRRGSAGRDGWK